MHRKYRPRVQQIMRKKNDRDEDLDGDDEDADSDDVSDVCR